ncbi:probable LRR receptor-like serine/threonine-protein kinase At1g51880 isoform X1 [Arachis hypogaea]|uniref:probable LRR receptor-like serine/threonine-protein kinase At1g51880 isoform X1 n=1 Tax=Arachis hypogaea TaxID=3818 RepID=UPI003B22173E
MCCLGSSRIYPFSKNPLPILVFNWLFDSLQLTSYTIWLSPDADQQHVTRLEGTFGLLYIKFDRYSSPEYLTPGIVDEKTDVYAFGILLLEILTERKNNEPGKTGTSANGIHSNRILGRNASGTVYHGFIEDIQVAVKMLSLSSVHGYQQFVAEVKLLMRVYHRNLTSIIGYCNEETNIGLIYEYMANGNLDEHLSGFDLASTNFPPNNNILPPQTSIEVVNQRDTDLFFMWQRYKILEHEAEEKA